VLADRRPERFTTTDSHKVHKPSSPSAHVEINGLV